MIVKFLDPTRAHELFMGNKGLKFEEAVLLGERLQPPFIFEARVSLCLETRRFQVSRARALGNSGLGDWAAKV